MIYSGPVQSRVEALERVNGCSRYTPPGLVLREDIEWFRMHGDSAVTGYSSRWDSDPNPDLIPDFSPNIPFESYAERYGRHRYCLRWFRAAILGESARFRDFRERGSWWTLHPDCCRVESDFALRVSWIVRDLGDASDNAALETLVRKSAERILEDTPFVYFIGWGRRSPVKIGKSINGGTSRLSAIQSGNPYPLEVIYETKAFSESEVHSALSDFRLEREWFRGRRHIDWLIEEARKLDGAPPSVVISNRLIDRLIERVS